MLNKLIIFYCFTISLSFFTSLSSAAENKRQIRDFSVGMNITSIDPGKYFFSCNGKTIKTLTDYQQCPADPNKLTEVNVSYNDSTAEWGDVNDKWLGTKIAGHPVLISIYIGINKDIERIDVQTDPNSRAYMKKKSFLLGNRIKSQFGSLNWRCSNKKSAENTKVGDVFINELCRKDFNGYSVVTHVEFFNKNINGKKNYINSTKLSIVKTS